MATRALRPVSQNEVLETTPARPKESNSEAHQDEQAASLEALPLGLVEKEPQSPAPTPVEGVALAAALGDGSRERNEAVVAVVAIMRDEGYQPGEYLEVQRECCRVMADLTAGSHACTEAVLASDAASMLVRAMMALGQVRGLRARERGARRGSTPHPPTSHPLPHPDLLPPQDAAVQRHGCRALTNLSCGADECRKAVRDAGGANALMLAMEMHPEDLPLARLRLAPCIATCTHCEHAHHPHARAGTRARPDDTIAGRASRACAAWARRGWHRGGACAARGARNPVRCPPSAFCLLPPAFCRLPLVAPRFGAGPARTHAPTRPPRGSWVLPHTAEELAAVGIGSLLEAVELLLRFHPEDVDGPHGPAGCSLLQHAARHGLLLLARRLLLRGADPGLAVHLAADCGQVAMVRLLLQWGAPLDALDERGVTMLSKARGRGAAGSGREVASLLESSAKAAQELREASRAVVSILPKQARSAHRLAW